MFKVLGISGVGGWGFRASKGLGLESLWMQGLGIRIVKSECLAAGGFRAHADKDIGLRVKGL